MSIVSLLMVPPSQQNMVAIAEEAQQIRLAGKFLIQSLGFTQEQAIGILAIDGVPERVCCIMVGKKVERLEGRLARLNMPKELVRTGEGTVEADPLVIQQKPNKNTIVQSGVGYLQKDEILSYPGLSTIFQEKINTLVNEGASTWQQRMDAIITVWNRQHRDAQIYKYVQKGDRKKAGDSWRGVYGIDCSLDFQTLFGVTFPDWMQAKKKGRKMKVGSPVADNLPEPKIDDITEPTQAVGAGFPGFVTPDALDAHNRLNGGKKVRVDRMPRQSMASLKPKRRLNPSKPLPPTIEITDKKERKEHACNVFNELLTLALTEYAKGKTLTWKTSQFTGMPTVASGHLTTEFSEKSTTLMIQGCQEIECDIWNAFQAKDFVQIMKRKAGVSYKEGERKYILKTDTGTLVLALPARFQRQKIDQKSEETGPTIYASTEKMNAMKHDFYDSINTYLQWYHREHIENKNEMQSIEFLMDTIPTQFRTRVEAEKFILEGSFPSKADFGNPVRQKILEALHDVPVIKRFLESHPGVSRLFLNTKSGEGQNITFVLEGKDGTTRVIFRPYLSK